MDSDDDKTGILVQNHASFFFTLEDIGPFYGATDTTVGSAMSFKALWIPWLSTEAMN